jgi:hypothetical protein
MSMTGSTMARLAILPRIFGKPPRLGDALIAFTIIGVVALVGWLGSHALNRLAVC